MHTDEAEFARFEADLRQQGYDTVLRRPWDPLTVVDTHSHPFDAKARVVQGEMWLTQGDTTRHVGIGEGFELAAGVPHSERYGADGATYWVGRRNLPSTAT
ncbi:MAG: AraC family transcriptional regulator [Rubrivivax sp.]